METTEASRLVDAETGKERCRLQEKMLKIAAFSPDDQLLSTISSKDGDTSASVSLWSTETGNLIRRFSIPIWAARDLDSFSSDGRIILTQGSSAVYLWGAQSGKRLLEWPGHEGFITALAYLPDGRSLLTSSSDETTRIWDIATSRSQRVTLFRFRDAPIAGIRSDEYSPRLYYGTRS
jgi:WD40 repeat protein